MPRKKGTPNTPQITIDEINKKHKNGSSLRELAIEYGKPFKTIKNTITRENNKKRRRKSGQLPKPRERKAAVALQEYKYENNRLRTRVCYTYPSSVTSTITASLHTKWVQRRPSDLCWIQFERPREKKRSPQSCNSTVIKGFNTPQTHILT